MKTNKKTEQKITELETRLMRALADYQNLEKRHSHQRSETIKYANQTLLDKLLPLLDDLNRAQDHLNDAGIDIVINHFRNLLTSEGVTEIKAKGQEFNPETMDCVEVVNGKKNHVISVLTKGYLYGDKVLRPARVNVGGGVGVHHDAPKGDS